MLDNETRKRIDTARDILVGKVPDPKSQVEQITIALIYKFMDDMDKEAVEFGGEATFFSAEYEKYAWSKIFDAKLGGHEMLNLYGDAIVKLNQNPNIPQLFRDIFKNAYLPYRDPETLKLFLKTINEFRYDHSEMLGDAFEYLLSALGSQGDAGQFRTPRHIIDFIVQILEPKKGESICDPACGTAGFLISSYKYIVEQNTKKNKGDLLTPDDRKKLMQNFVGYDISPDMVRLSLVNMYLHGFTTPKISEYDTLTSEEKWNEYFDVILANPPFMTPKGGIKPHKKFTIQASKSEVLFTDYIAEHINPSTGRAAIVVPEGIIFQTATAYKKLRKLMHESSLYAVISLPKGIFQPYSDIKTSILLLDRNVAKKTTNILFLKVENDGFDLGAQRRPIDKNDLPLVGDLIKEYRTSLVNNSNFSIEGYENQLLLISKDTIAKKDYILSAEKYRVQDDNRVSDYPMVKLEDILDYEQPTKYIVSDVNYNDSYETPVLTAGKTFILGYTDETNGIFENHLPVIIFDDFTTASKFVDFPFKVKSSAMKILHAKKGVANIKYIYYLMQTIKFKPSEHKRFWISEYSKLEVPLPPIDLQNEIIKKIEDKEADIQRLKSDIEETQSEIISIVENIWG